MVDGEVHGGEHEPRGRGVRIEPLTQSTLTLLRLGWSSRFDLAKLSANLRQHPGLSLWIPETGEYLIGGSWRHRGEVAGMLELSARANAIPVLDEFAEIARDEGKQLAIASEHHESRRRAFYESAGFELLEDIVIYELARGLPPSPGGALQLQSVDVNDELMLAELTALDHAAFPWLWWNSREEFENYGGSPGVELYLFRDNSGAAVAYIGITHFRDWGHLDRIAVAPGLQGRGYGREALDWAVHFLSRAGARRIGLSTQARNTRSRQLYERYGFRRAPVQDYALYGRWLVTPPEEFRAGRG